MSLFLSSVGFIFRVIYSLALYIGIAIALYSIAVRNNVKKPWIAFIPVFQYYIIGSLCEEYVIKGFRITKLGWFMVLLSFLQMCLGFVSGFSFLMLSILVNVLIVLILHKFFYLFEPQRAVIYALLSLLGRLPLVIILFMIKDRNIIMSAGAFPYPFE